MYGSGLWSRLRQTRNPALTFSENQEVGHQPAFLFGDLQIQNHPFATRKRSGRIASEYACENNDYIVFVLAKVRRPCVSSSAAESSEPSAATVCRFFDLFLRLVRTPYKHVLQTLEAARRE